MASNAACLPIFKMLTGQSRAQLMDESCTVCMSTYGFYMMIHGQCLSIEGSVARVLARFLFLNLISQKVSII